MPQNEPSERYEALLRKAIELQHEYDRTWGEAKGLMMYIDVLTNLLPRGVIQMARSVARRVHKDNERIFHGASASELPFEDGERERVFEGASRAWSEVVAHLDDALEIPPSGSLWDTLRELSHHTEDEDESRSLAKTP